MSENNEKVTSEGTEKTEIKQKTKAVTVLDTAEEQTANIETASKDKNEFEPHEKDRKSAKDSSKRKIAISEAEITDSKENDQQEISKAIKLETETNDASPNSSDKEVTFSSAKKSGDEDEIEANPIKRRKLENERSLRVAHHYNTIPTLGREERQKSQIINLRNINNYIKAVLINLYVNKDDSVLDLGCGKGGDLLKYKHRRIKFLYGIDIADESINEYKNRLNKSKNPFETKLEVLDMCNHEIITDRKFEVISLQFSIHYAFESEKTFTTLLNSIKRAATKGTAVIITTIDQSRILSHYNDKLVTNKPCGYCKKKEMCVGNSLFHIELENIKANKVFGDAYTFFLKDAVNKCEEFLVPCGYLVDEFEKAGFELEENKCFGNFLEKYDAKFKNLKSRMVPGKLTQEEEEIMDIYRVIVFKKVE